MIKITKEIKDELTNLPFFTDDNYLNNVISVCSSYEVFIPNDIISTLKKWLEYSNVLKSKGEKYTNDAYNTRNYEIHDIENGALPKYMRYIESLSEESYNKSIDKMLLIS